MNNLTLDLVILAGAAAGCFFIFLGNVINKAKKNRAEKRRSQQDLAQLKKEAERRKKANEQKENMETGDHSADFDAGIDALNELRNKSAARK